MVTLSFYLRRFPTSLSFSVFSALFTSVTMSVACRLQRLLNLVPLPTCPSLLLVLILALLLFLCLLKPALKLLNFSEVHGQKHPNSLSVCIGEVIVLYHLNWLNCLWNSVSLSNVSYSLYLVAVVKKVTFFFWSRWHLGNIKNLLLPPSI